MNKIPNLTALAFGLLLLTACDKNDVAEDIIEPDVPEVPTDSTTTGMPMNLVTRAIDAGVIKNVSVGLYASNYIEDVYQELQSSGNYIDNMCLEYKDGIWRTDTPFYWYDSKTQMDFYAYAPYNAKMSTCRDYLFNLPIDQRPDESLASADFMWGRLLGVYPSADEVSLNVNHMFAKVLVNIVPDESYAQDELKPADLKVELGGMKVAGTIDLMTGGVRLSGNTSTIVMHDNGDLTYSAVVMPQALGFVNLVRVTKGDDFYPLQGSITFERGKTYTLSVTIGKKGVGGLNVGISSWEIDEKDYGGTVE